MSDRVRLRPRLLIVEDRKSVVNEIKHHLGSLLADEEKSHYGIDDFEFSEAFDFESAMQKLRSARESSTPFTLVLLDLGLPKTEGDPDDEIKRGFGLLEYAVGKSSIEPDSGDEKQGSGAPAALGAIVISVFQDYPDVVKAFKLGAVDFIGKDLDKNVPGEILRQQVLTYFKRQVIDILNRRIKNLMPHAQTGLANRLGACFSTFVERVMGQTELLKVEAEERWGLDPVRDSTDRHIRHLTELDHAVKSATNEWRQTQSSLLGRDERERVCVLEASLKELEWRILPCLMLKNVRLSTKRTDAQTRVMSFQEDVPSVLSELLLGAMSEIPDHDDSENEVRISVGERAGYAEVRLLDNLAAIPHEHCEMINSASGSSIKRFGYGRVWGLSLAQYVAMRGGGSLSVEPRGNRGNVITYRIPLAHHD